MGSLLEKNSKLLKFVFVVMISSIAYFYSLGAQDIWVLLWVAPLLLCMYVLKASFVASLCVGFFTSFISGSALILAASYPMDLVKILLCEIFAGAIAFAIVLSVFRYITIRYNHWLTSLVFASGLTAYEFIVSLFSRGGSVSSIAYTQITNIPVIQIASVTGIWGITFLLSIVPAGIALAWHYRKNHQLCTKALLLPVGLLSLTMIFGVCRLSMPLQQPSIKVGSAAEPMTLEEYISVATNKDSQKVSEVIQRYTRDIEKLSQSGAKVVLLPEKTLTLSSQQDLLQKLTDTANQNKVYLIAGLSSQDNENFYNSAFVFSPSGERLLRYDKQHLLPPFENKYTPGNSLGIVNTPSMGTWGIEICKDMDFTYPALEYSQQGISLMFVPALDFHSDGWTHGRIAIMRGIEGNYAVARAGQWGLLTLSDSRGHIIEMKPTDASANATLLLGDLTLGTGKSIYSQLGDWFGWSCVVIFILSLIIPFLPKKIVLEHI